MSAQKVSERRSYGKACGVVSPADADLVVPPQHGLLPDRGGDGRPQRVRRRAPRRFPEIPSAATCGHKLLDTGPSFARSSRASSSLRGLRRDERTASRRVEPTRAGVSRLRVFTSDKASAAAGSAARWRRKSAPCRRLRMGSLRGQAFLSRLVRLDKAERQRQWHDSKTTSSERCGERSR